MALLLAIPALVPVCCLPDSLLAVLTLLCVPETLQLSSLSVSPCSVQLSADVCVALLLALPALVPVCYLPDSLLALLTFLCVSETPQLSSSSVSPCSVQSSADVCVALLLAIPALLPVCRLPDSQPVVSTLGLFLGCGESPPYVLRASLSWYEGERSEDSDLRAFARFTMPLLWRSAHHSVSEPTSQQVNSAPSVHPGCLTTNSQLQASFPFGLGGSCCVASTLSLGQSLRFLEAPWPSLLSVLHCGVQSSAEPCVVLLLAFLAFLSVCHLNGGLPSVSKCGFRPVSWCLLTFVPRASPPWYEGARIGEALHPGPDFSVQPTLHSLWRSPAQPPVSEPTSQIVNGPLHNTCRVVVANPTAVLAKEMELRSFGAQLLLLAETSATAATQRTVACSMAKHGYRSFWSHPVAPHMAPRDQSESRRGCAGGAAVLSTLTAHAPFAPVDPALWDTQRVAFATNAWGPWLCARWPSMVIRVTTRMQLRKTNVCLQSC